MKKTFLFIMCIIIPLCGLFLGACDKNDKNDPENSSEEDDTKYETEIDEFLKNTDNDNYELAGSKWGEREIKYEEWTEIEKYCVDIKWCYDAHMFDEKEITGLYDDLIFNDSKCEFRGDRLNYTYTNGRLIMRSSCSDDEDDYGVYEGTFTIDEDKATYTYVCNRKEVYDGPYDGDYKYGRELGKTNEEEKGTITYRLKEGIYNNNSLDGTVWEFVDIQGELSVDNTETYISGTNEEDNSHYIDKYLNFHSNQMYFGSSSGKMYDYVYKDGRLVMKNKFKRIENLWGGELPNDCSCIVTTIYDGQLALQYRNGTYDYIYTRTETRKGGGYEYYSDIYTEKKWTEWEKQ